MAQLRAAFSLESSAWRFLGCCFDFSFMWFSSSLLTQQFYLSVPWKQLWRAYVCYRKWQTWHLAILGKELKTSVKIKWTFRTEGAPCCFTWLTMNCCFHNVWMFAFVQLSLMSYHSWLSACCSCSFSTLCLNYIFSPKSVRMHRAGQHFPGDDKCHLQGLWYLQEGSFLVRCTLGGTEFSTAEQQEWKGKYLLF